MIKRRYEPDARTLPTAKNGKIPMYKVIKRVNSRPALKIEWVTFSEYDHKRNLGWRTYGDLNSLRHGQAKPILPKVIRTRVFNKKHYILDRTYHNPYSAYNYAWMLEEDLYDKKDPRHQGFRYRVITRGGLSELWITGY
jgi:hypothetical protein